MAGNKTQHAIKHNRLYEAKDQKDDWVEIMKIIILGDIGASETNMRAFCGAKKDLFSSEIQGMCADADIVLLNLEKPLTDVISPLGKCPPDYYAPTDTIHGIKLLYPRVVTLANNHIMDQREQGLQSTMDVLAQNGIQYVGAGSNLDEARKPIIIDEKGIKVGIYACCEKEFSFATEKTAGANVLDPLETFDDIVKLRASCDYLIVLFHGGMQGYPYPTPYQQRVCRKMCDKGADLVVCQHSHIIGCEEDYAGGRIVYGQGNFLLDDVADESWHSGLIIVLAIENGNSSVDYIPTLTREHKVIVHPDSDSVREAFLERSRVIAKENAVAKLFSNLCDKKLSDYLVKLSGKRRLVQRAFRRLGITKHYWKLYTKDACNMILDYLYCNSHREAIEYGLQRFIQEKEKNDSRGK